MIFSLWICCVIERLAVVARTVLAAYSLLYWAELQYWRWHAYSTVKEKKEMGMREMKHHNPLYVNFLFLPALVLTSLDYVYRPVKYFSSACRILPKLGGMIPPSFLPRPQYPSPPQSQLSLQAGSSLNLKENWRNLVKRYIHLTLSEMKGQFLFFLWSLVAWRFRAPFQFPEFFNRLTEYAKNKKPPYFALWSNNLFPSSTII